MNEEKLNTDQKALQINIDKAKYGTFAEIGAGQEVARWFFRVGGAAGTVAKTISAYDMTVSDAIYGPAERYVSRQRLQAMLAYEYKLLVERLDKPRGDKTCFFAFANTVATRSFTRHEEGHGWMGIQFQAQPRQPPSEIIIHVRMLDSETVREQEAVGMMGVNLIHSAYNRHPDPVRLVATLMDGLSNARVEVDMIRFSGPCFAGVDNRLMALLDMLECAEAQFFKEPALAGETPVTLMEMTLRQLQVGEGIDHRDFLDRVDTLGALKKPVLISNFLRYHRLVQYLSQHTQKMIGLPLGLARMRDVMDEKFYTDLKGGLMESLGQLLRTGVKLYVYPWLDRETGKIVTIGALDVAPNLRHLFAHLVENHFIEDIRGYNPDFLSVNSGAVLQKLQSGDASWEQQVPPPIAEVIKAKKLFGCK
jgi:hypothetical protein